MKTEDFQKNFVEAVEAINAKNNDSKLQIIKTKIQSVDSLGINYYFVFQGHEYSAKASVACAVGETVYVLFSESGEDNVVIARDNSQIDDGGVIISNIQQQYYLSNDKVTPPDEKSAAWSLAIPETTKEALYIWQRTKSIYSDGRETYSGVSLFNGESDRIKKDAADNAASQITDATGTSKDENGQFDGGYIVLQKNGNKTVSILAMDNMSEALAKNKIELNSEGICFYKKNASGLWEQKSAWKMNTDTQGLDGHDVDITNLTVASFYGHQITLGGSDQKLGGSLVINDSTGNKMGVLDTNGLQIWGPDGSSVKMNDKDGFAGYDNSKEPKRIYGSNGTSFDMVQANVSNEIDLGGKLKMIPMTVLDSSGNKVNDGIGFISI